LDDICNYYNAKANIRTSSTSSTTEQRISTLKYF
jgi:hypothetical protein